MAKRNAAPRRAKKTSTASPSLLKGVANVLGSLKEPGQRDNLRKLVGWGLLFFTLASLVASVSYLFTGQADQSVAEAGAAYADRSSNWLGYFGVKVSDLFIARGFGLMAFPVQLYLLLWALIVLENDYYFFGRRLLKYVVFIAFFGSMLLGFILDLAGSHRLDLGGGIGYFLNQWLYNFIGKVGVAFLLLCALMAFLAINFQAELKASKILDPLKRRNDTSWFGPSDGEDKVPVLGRLVRLFNPNASPTPAPETSQPPVSRRRSPRVVEDDDEDEVPFVVPKPKPETAQRQVDFALKAPEPDAAEPGEQLEFTIVSTQPADEPVKTDVKRFEQIGDDNIGLVVDGGTVEKIVPETDQELDDLDDLVDWQDFDPTQELSDYLPPMLELLDDHGAGRNREVNRDELVENKNKIVDTLKNYGIEITNIKATIGPTVTLYEIVPAPGVRISKIRNLEDDIALNLAALGIRIIAPIPGKGTIGIEVPNSNPEIVSLRSVLSTAKFLSTPAELPIALGRTISNEVFVADLNKMPHLLIAGATGQGKSVGLNTVIASILFKKHPAEVKFVLIDPKKVEMSLYSSLRNHFLAQLPDVEDPIITDVKDAVNVLKSLGIEMDHRYDLLKRARVRNLKEYNQKFTARKLSPRKGHRFLPYIILVIDELADMMMVSGKEVEMPIARLAQLARAVGIHLVVATQRPSVNVITGIIKANFPARLSYRVISKVDSRTILDANGADQLVGRGDMLLYTGSDLIRIQNAFIDTPEIERMVEYISKQRGFPEPYYLPEVPVEDGGDKDDDDDEPLEKDDLFNEAARLIVRYQLGSASLIQRKMKLGYNRAGRIIDQMEKAGIVGPHSGSKAREVLIHTESELEQYLKSV